MRVLVIEDNKDFAKTLAATLRKEGFAVDKTHTGTDGAYLAQVNNYDLIILDIMLPDINGVEICKQTRAAQITTPILMLTGRADIDSKVSSLDSGADDYLTKPFNRQELCAHVRALLRRSPDITAPSKIIWRSITLDTTTKQVRIGGKNLRLRNKEFELLKHFLKNPEVVFTKEMLLEQM